MKLGYTEFSFGYAFTENLIRFFATGPIGAPVFPNLLQEAHLGYDVRIDLPACPVFFQYKLPELMVRETAAEIAKHALPGLSVPFFRMSLMRRDLSDQHKLLIGLEKQFPDAVFYVAPVLPNVNSFDAAYKSAHVHQQSVFFSPGEIGPLPDDKPHVVAYGSAGAAWTCSEPQRIEARRFEAIEERVRAHLGETRYRTLESTAAVIGSAVLERVTPEMRAAEGGIRARVRQRMEQSVDDSATPIGRRRVAEDLVVYREIARVGLGLEMTVAQARPRK